MQDVAMPRSVYAYIWRTTGSAQIPVCALTVVVVLLSMAPLELQRQIMDQALGARDIALLTQLAIAYLVLLFLQGGLKYLLNVSRGKLVEDVTRRLRETIFDCIGDAEYASLPEGDERRLQGGAMASMVAAEVEDVGGFVGESISLPLLQGGTVVAVTGYLAWLDPLIATFAVIIYIPQMLIVPPVQHAINRLARVHARQVRKLGDEVVGRSEAEDIEVKNFATRFKRTALQTYDTRIRIYRKKFFLTALGNLLDALGPLIILILGGWLVIRGRTEVSTIVVFISGFQKISDPWDQLVNFYRSASNAQTKYTLIRDSLICGWFGADEGTRTPTAFATGT